MPLGLYISVPFCRTKCSYCNFASGVFSRAVFAKYTDKLCFDIASAQTTAENLGCAVDRAVDSIYLGGGTPTVLEPAELERIFHAIREHLDVDPCAEITIECAPGTLTPAMLESLLRCGVNRVSLGVQSFVDGEAAAVGRLHTREVTLCDIATLRAAGIPNINIDLIAGLPHHTAESWRRSLDETIATGVPHVSVYMLEIDEDSRLGRELIAGGTRYHAHFVPDEDATADFYLAACELLDSAGVHQYEVSNFARYDCESRHNLKYWTRQPYLGFGVDAHSMLFGLRAPGSELRANSEVIASEDRARGIEPGVGSMYARSESRDLALRFSTPDSLDAYLDAAPLMITTVSRSAALEETFFLGLRLTCGIDLCQVATDFGVDVQTFYGDVIRDLRAAALVTCEADNLRLTPRGRLLSNEVFQRFLIASGNESVEAQAFRPAKRS